MGNIYVQSVDMELIFIITILQYNLLSCLAPCYTFQMTSLDPKQTLAVLSSYPITTLCAPPTLYRMWMNHGLTNCKFPSLKHCVSAGEPLNPEVIKKWYNYTGNTMKQPSINHYQRIKGQINCHLDNME